MNPVVENISTHNDTLTFTLQNVNVSIANALRRVMIANIPTVVIRSTPYEKNDVDIEVNTTRLNNEIIKQRLSCIPIFIRNVEEDALSEYEIEIDEANTTPNMKYITTGHFKVKHNGTYFKKKTCR